MESRRARALFESHYHAVYGFVLRSCADPAVAEDLTQDVFVRALRSRRAGSVTNERPWLLRIARNLLIDRWRRSERIPQHLEALECDSAAIPPAELRTDLHGALARLPTAQREAFLLREVGGLSYVEIAAVTGTSPAAVRSSIYRARRQLRQSLSETPAVGGLDGEPRLAGQAKPQSQSNPGSKSPSNTETPPSQEDFDAL